jgi:hypothetical protein
MQCPSCNAAIPDDSVFCESCGATQTAAAVPLAQQPSPAYHAAAAAQGLGTSVKSFWGALDLAGKIATGGCIAVVLGFFLAWVDVPSTAGLTEALLGGMGGAANPFAGGGMATTSLSGFSLAGGWGVIYIYPLLAILSFVLLYLAIYKNRSTANLLTTSGWLVLIGSLIGPQSLLMLIFVPAIQKLVGIGFWLNTLGFCAIAVGGILNIRTLSRKLP